MPRIERMRPVAEPHGHEDQVTPEAELTRPAVPFGVAGLDSALDPFDRQAVEEGAGPAGDLQHVRPGVVVDAEELADQYLVMERGEIVMRGRGADMAADGVKDRMAI